MKINTANRFAGVQGLALVAGCSKSASRSAAT
jgi:hypothetical protein